MKRFKIHEQRRVFDDVFKIDEARLQFEKFDGSWSEPVRRLCFERGDSAAALLHEIDADAVLLVNQFRYPAAHKASGWIEEIVAGSIAPEESPEACIRREILEETGYRAERLEPLAQFFASPGGSSERIFLFYAPVREADREAAGGGAPGEHEDIEIVHYPLEELWRRLDAGQFQDAKTLIALWRLRRKIESSE